MTKLYIASSWRNEKQPEIIRILRREGYKVYDFRNPSKDDIGFHWSEIDPTWKSWTPQKYIDCLNHPIAQKGFENDFKAMEWADIFIGIQPFGRSASLEMGWACGRQKPTILLLDNGEPELMVKMIDYIFCEITEMLKCLKNISKKTTT